MVSEKKKDTLKGLVVQIDEYPVVGMLDMHKLPARQLHMIKEQLKGKAVIRMVKKRILKLALEQCKKKNISKLSDIIQGQPALLFSKGNPFELAQAIAKSKSKAPAKAGDIAPRDIIVPAGPTSLPPGPAIGDLQRAKIQAGVEGDKIVVKKDAKVAKEGDVITPELADLLPKLDIEPMEISLNLIAVWDDGLVFDKDILFIPQEHYVGQLQTAYSSAFNLAINIGFVTSDTVPILITKAHTEAKAVAIEAGIITDETAGTILAKAEAQKDALKALVKDAPPEAPAEDKKEEPAAEEKPPEPTEEKAETAEEQKPEGDAEKPAEEKAEEAPAEAENKEEEKKEE
jgi:large subunit ribosomal protein L10